MKRPSATRSSATWGRVMGPTSRTGQDGPAAPVRWRSACRISALASVRTAWRRRSGSWRPTAAPRGGETCSWASATSATRKAGIDLTRETVSRQSRRQLRCRILNFFFFLFLDNHTLILRRFMIECSVLKAVYITSQFYLEVHVLCHFTPPTRINLYLCLRN